MKKTTQEWAKPVIEKVKFPQPPMELKWAIQCMDTISTFKFTARQKEAWQVCRKEIMKGNIDQVEDDNPNFDLPCKSKMCSADLMGQDCETCGKNITKWEKFKL